MIVIIYSFRSRWSFILSFIERPCRFDEGEKKSSSLVYVFVFLLFYLFTKKKKTTIHKSDRKVSPQQTITMSITTIYAGLGLKDIYLVEQKVNAGVAVNVFTLANMTGIRHYQRA